MESGDTMTQRSTFYQIAICDDQEEQLNQLKSFVSRWSLECGLRCQVHSFSSGEEFLFTYEENKAYDILILDVEMKELSGIQLAKRIRANDKRVEILFVTSHFEFIAEGYEVDALHYLVKPIAEDKLRAVLDKAAEKLNTEPPFVIISCEGETVKLYEEDILYVESFLHYISIHTKEREYRIKENISSFAERLSADFFRIHRSYLVQLKAVRRILRTCVCIEGGQELPLARGKYDDINRAFVQRN